VHAQSLSGQSGSGKSAFEEALLAHGGMPNLAAYPPELLQQAALLGGGISSDALQARAFHPPPPLHLLLWLSTLWHTLSRGCIPHSSLPAGIASSAAACACARLGVGA
jgi:hypothetical protein